MVIQVKKEYCTLTTVQGLDKVLFALKFYPNVTIGT